MFSVAFLQIRVSGSLSLGDMATAPPCVFALLFYSLCRALPDLLTDSEGGHWSTWGLPVELQDSSSVRGLEKAV